jgi:hypothetical protein
MPGKTGVLTFRGDLSNVKKNVKKKPPDNIGVKAIQLQEDVPSKTALIRTGLTDK